VAQISACLLAGWSVCCAFLTENEQICANGRASRRHSMKFTPLHSRGGDYMVALQNVAYLRNDENGQTKIGLVGGDSLLVVGSMEEVADMIVESTRKAKVAPKPV
jgi:uncharacterized protein YlzI (FlbEa/FlbD family)